MKKLRAADITDASVDGPRRRRAEVYVPSSLRPLSVLELALPPHQAHRPAPWGGAVEHGHGRLSP